MNGSNEQEQGATPSGSGCQPTASAADASSQSGIPSAAIAELCGAIQEPLGDVVRKFVDEAYNAILDTTQDYLLDNASFNLQAKLDAATAETVRAYKALAAVENSIALSEAKANAYAAAKGYWSEARANEYRIEAEQSLAAARKKLEDFAVGGAA